MLFSGILTAVGLVAITAKFSRSFLEKILGYDWAIDLMVTLGLPILFYGTYSGMMTAVITGLSISFILWIAKNLIGYQKYEVVEGKRVWNRHHGKWTPMFLGEQIHNWFKVSFTSAVNDFQSGWTDGEKKATTHA